MAHLMVMAMSVMLPPLHGTKTGVPGDPNSGHLFHTHEAHYVCHYVSYSWILGTDPNYRNDCSLANFGPFDLIFVANKGL